MTRPKILKQFYTTTGFLYVSYRKEQYTLVWGQKQPIKRLFLPEPGSPILNTFPMRVFWGAKPWSETGFIIVKHGILNSS